MEIKDLKKDKRNYRIHNQRNLDLIKKSVDEVGFGRAIVIDNENEIIAGNGLVSSVDKNTKIKVVESDGSELIVVKRTDLATNDEKRKQLAIMDNSTSDSSEFDLELLQEDFATSELYELGIDIIDSDDEVEDITYTKKITSPVYEITMDREPSNEECINLEKYNELVAEIESAEINDEDKELLKICASRHIVFSYKNIAEKYARSSGKVQELMEKSALIIIDYDKAIEYGYSKLHDDILKLRLEDE